MFPNYYPLEQSKYMFKNIERKQKAINEQQEFEDRQLLKKRIAAGQSQLGDVSWINSSTVFKSDVISYIEDNSDISFWSSMTNSIHNIVKQYIDQDSNISLGQSERSVFRKLHF